MLAHADVSRTVLNRGTEAPDETAQGEWLNLVAKAGFSYLMANVKYLSDGQYTVQRIEEDAAAVGFTSLFAGSTPATASTTAFRCSGPVPQHPPTIRTP